jgi:PAS domain-containing protein
MLITTEEMIAYSTLFGFAGSALIFLWRMFRVCGVFLRDWESQKQAVETIKLEVTANGGKSIKDVIDNLKVTCDYIVERQTLVDQRLRAAFRYHADALFEIDYRGSMTWHNNRFEELTKDTGEIEEGLNWISIVHEDERKAFINELHSCLKMCRKIDITTEYSMGGKIKFVGFPYRVSPTIHKGYLIHCFFIT